MSEIHQIIKQQGFVHMSSQSVKCACDRCLCEVSLVSAISRNNQYYCSEGCANGHAEGKGCSKSSCGCGS